MKTLNGQELELFRAGDYGAKGTYTPEDLQQLAAGYDPAKHEVPLVIGHPKLNGPAFGWLKSLRAQGDKLFGTFGQVVPAFDQAVQQGLYKKRSIALARTPDGKLDLRHVGYLGAMLPEVRGLADAAFSVEPFEEIEFSVEPQGDVTMSEEQKREEQQRQTIREMITEFFAGSFGKKTETAGDVAALEARLESKFNAALTAKDAEIAKLRTDFSAQQTEGAEQARNRRVEGVVNQLKVDKRWIPAFDKMQVPAIFSALAAAPAQEITFSEGTVEHKLDPVAAFAKFLSGLGKIVPQGEVFAAKSTATSAEVPRVDGATVSAGSAAFDAEIKAYMTEHKVSYAAAADTLTREGKSSLTYGGATGGEV